jgi:DinB superfamily
MTTNKTTLHAMLDQNRQAMTDYVNSLSDAQFVAQPNGKWSAGEHLQHLFLSTRALNRVLNGPREFFDQWPRTDRPSRNIEEVKNAYLSMLAGLTAVAPASVLPRAEDIENRAEVIARFDNITRDLAETLTNWIEEDLDSYQVPHPRLGMLTVREFFSFSAYHILHHLEPMRARLS